MALSYISTNDILYLTWSKLDGTTILTAIGEQAEREVVAYLASKGITSPSGNAVKSASLKLAHAGVLARYNAEKTVTKTDGASGTTYQDYQDDPAGMIAQLRKEAFQLLDMYAATQTPAGSYSSYVYKVNR